MAGTARRKGRPRSQSRPDSAKARSTRERFGREQGLGLPDLSASAASIAVPREHEEPLLAYAAWTVRSRTLLKAIFVLADRGHRTEAGILSRSLLETAITMRWVALDGQTNYERWVLADCRDDVTWDSKIQGAAKANPTWSHPDALPDGYMDQVRATIANLEAAKVTGAPDIRQMAEQVGYFDVHPIVYRLYNGLVHGSTMMVLNPLARPLGDGKYIVSADSQMNGYPYWMPALLFVDVLKVACATLGFPWLDELRRIETTLRTGPGRTRPEAADAWTGVVFPEARTLLASLQCPDELTLRFSPYGFGAVLSPEDAAAFQDASIAEAVLVEQVPDDVAANFARARQLFLYGVLEYTFFTAAADYVVLVLEGALRLRFISFYDGEIPVMRGDTAETLPVRSFDDVRGERKVSLRGVGGTKFPLPIGAGALLDWARREELIGDRSGSTDDLLAQLRDHAAHPVSQKVIAPPAAATILVAVAELINALWTERE